MIKLLNYLLFSFITILLFACTEKQTALPLIFNEKNTPIETGTDVAILYSDSAVPQFKMSAPLMERFTTPEEYMEMTKGVKMEFYNQESEVNSHLTANYAIRYEKDGKMEAKGNVILINIKEEKLETEHLIWDEQKELIHTKARVKITTKNEILFGEGLESNRDFTRYKILKLKGSKIRKD